MTINRQLTKAEGEELGELHRDMAKAVRVWSRYCELYEACLLYGSEGVTPRSFAGLEPRYEGDICDERAEAAFHEWKTDQ